MRTVLTLVSTSCLLLIGCASDRPASGEETTDTDAAAPATAFSIAEHDQFEAPWALEFLPGTDDLLITQRTGGLMLRDQASGEVREVSGAPNVDSAGQGGMHDVVASPTFEQDQVVYLSWVSSSDDGAQGRVGRAELNLDEAELGDIEEIWQQDPAQSTGHFALRMLMHEDHLFVTSGDRQESDLAQDLESNLGSIVRLTLAGEPAPGSPFAEDSDAAAGLYTIGHRNPLGIAADSQGNLWSSEMGPEGGDELNLIIEGANYGWPEVSMGVHYGGGEIPDHSDNDEFEPPRTYWVPAISPGNLLIYQGDLFTGWRDSALLGGLSGQNLVRVELDGESAEQVDEWEMGERIRAVEEAPDGALWIATDAGALMELRPPRD
ncbi:PQQ-dependent sugar dehydrogenase [Nesterenkonia natronophila]|uniref:PQQ-dependent sugar dehydrogenase n=1 Tax=Nesterenkonia natronophila TaxID=2174932 RepID=A0A3A4F981_9MICC|nr:PQQ-dependent sugar dehydrogenase [Nesterenkonia natronophila]RJN31747.1 PQQ-dependent sugar dehydrogenase [Nesterenkonia natronophila]